MTEDELARLCRHIDKTMAAPLAGVLRAISDLERVGHELRHEVRLTRDVRSQLERLLAASHAPASFDRRQPETPNEPAPVAERRRHRPLATTVEPIGINRQRFQD